jgi:hypothetical protein
VVSVAAIFESPPAGAPSTRYVAFVLWRTWKTAGSWVDRSGSAFFVSEAVRSVVCGRFSIWCLMSTRLTITKE